MYNKIIAFFMPSFRSETQKSQKEIKPMATAEPIYHPDGNVTYFVAYITRKDGTKDYAKSHGILAWPITTTLDKHEAYLKRKQMEKASEPKETSTQISLNFEGTVPGNHSQ